VSEREVIAFCRERLAGFKVPKHVVHVAGAEGLPKTSTGKIQKFVLRARAREMAEEEARVKSDIGRSSS